MEPFAGSLAVLLNRPRPFTGPETVNDFDGFVANAWRAIRSAPDQVAEWADWPVSEVDLTARHAWLVERCEVLTARLMGDPDYFDPKIAGWWLWGISCWIGSGWCSGQGPWHSVEMPDGGRQLVHLGNAGRGVNRAIVHLGDAGQGVNRKRVHLFGYMRALAERLRDVRVCCGDWTRVMGESPLLVRTPVGVFLDPPYSGEAGREMDIYRIDSGAIAPAVRDWAMGHGDDPRYRICLAGYAGEGHEVLLDHGWQEVAWKAKGGYGSQRRGGANDNRFRERLFFSPHCLRASQRQMLLFSE